MVHISALVMVKDEEKRIHVTLNSIIGLDSLIVYDTGSTDKTIEIIQEFCRVHSIPLRLKCGIFVDFSTSRNVALEFADSFPDVDFILLMDSNDELQSETLRMIAERENNNVAKTAYLVCQKLKKKTSVTTFFNIRFIKPRSGWRYRGSVHEGFELNNDTIPRISKLPETVVLYQDRDQDDLKSYSRFNRDKELLLKDHLQNPSNPRTVYYLAQTLDGMGNFEESEKYHRLRVEMGGFIEERFMSAFRVACLQKEWEDSFKWYMKSYSILQRAEPLINIADHYHKTRQWNLGLGYHFAKLACELKYPENSLFYVERQAYDYN